MFRNLLQSLITKGLVAVINFIILVVTSRYLGVSSRGEISLFVLNIAFIQIINEVYTGYSLMYFIPKFDLKKIFFVGVVYTLLFSSLSNVVIVFLHKQIEGYEWIAYLISLLILLNTFHCVLLLGKENVKLYNIFSLLQPALLLLGLLFFIFVLRVYTFKAYVFPLLVSFGLAFIFSFLSVYAYIFKTPSNRPYKLNPILINGMMSQTGILMYFFCNRYSYYLLPDTAKVGLYSSASALAESVLIIVNSISPVLLARVANQVNPTKNADLTLSLSKASLFFSVLMLLILFLLPEALFISVLGAGFSGIKELIMIYAPGVMMISLFGAISNYFSASGQIRFVLYSNSIGFVTTLILAPMLVNRYDMVGAAYTANIAYFLIGLSLCITFGVTQNLSLGKLFSFKKDLLLLRTILFQK